VAAGLTNPQIAERRTLAAKTVSAHISHILAKLNASRRSGTAPPCRRVLRETVNNRPVRAAAY
jgi:DNA-binding NarL/FixJ family response regulator